MTETVTYGKLKIRSEENKMYICAKSSGQIVFKVSTLFLVVSVTFIPCGNGCQMVGLKPLRVFEVSREIQWGWLGDGALAGEIIS